jgi:hypothetical protein
LDYAFGSSIFEGESVDRTSITYDATTDVGKIILDWVTKGKRVAAQCIPLDIPAMGLDHKARYDLANLPWNKMKYSTYRRSWYCVPTCTRFYMASYGTTRL